MKVRLGPLTLGVGGLLVLGVVAVIAWRAFQKKRNAKAVAIVPGV